MKTLVLLGALAATLAVAAPARADHNALMVESEPSIDIDLKLGWNGFRLGTRLFGRDGYAGGAWLNGATRPDGFSLDGRYEHEGKARNFKMNVDLDEWLRRAARYWGWGRTDL
ncbi:MAG TPA: hypothetical protein VGT02_09360 [Methylomirabilota bacterium]|jgi:hypothetical protein|nr:hypothetical protein [Methylomirabilota bacterium]